MCVQEIQKEREGQRGKKQKGRVKEAGRNKRGGEKEAGKEPRFLVSWWDPFLADSGTMSTDWLFFG